MKKVLIINSLADKNCLLSRVFKELEQKKFIFSLWSSKTGPISRFRQNNRPAKKIFLGANLSANRDILFFFAILFFIQLKSFASLFYVKIKKRVNIVVCLNINEKIIFTLPAKILGLKIVWLEMPDLNYRQINGFLFFLYKINHRLASLIVFNNYSKLQLINYGFKAEQIKLILPGARPNHGQENIINKTAALSHFHKKYFTVGAIAELKEKQKIEAIFQSIKTCLPVIPNIQLIVIGDGEERKNLLWLSKKMKIENLVWLVGEQEELIKWLNSFDVFLSGSEVVKLDNYGNILEAMALGLPIIGPRNTGLEDLVLENKTGSLIEIDNNEMLARQIIKLHQDKKLRLCLGKNGQERVKRFFALEQMVNEFEQILK